MGQWWYIINIDTREHLGCWGKLGEFFFDSRRLWRYQLPVRGVMGGLSYLVYRRQCRRLPPPEELDEIKTLPGTDAEKTFLTLAVNTYKEIRAGDGYDLRGMVLRNLTMKFYVRRDVVVK
ncbi:hypothetical protein ARMGADRAFT_1164625 [Armillaria gallica]|uniref:Uncharacterized protein n=1 Tax=Armillaria gallica TaxID=47427 RepID=A0A2H3DZG4_ARMGA|nr:hypothetical protein ARMGADRAFT_1164625 [Armillaria gallica]